MHQNYCELSCRKIIKSFIQGFLPGIALKIFLILLPTILMIMSKIEGFTSLSSLERRSAAKYHLFILVNVFLGSIVTGTALQQLHKFLNQSPTEYVNLLLFSMKGLLSSVNVYVFWRVREENIRWTLMMKLLLSQLIYLLKIGFLTTNNFFSYYIYNFLSTVLSQQGRSRNFLQRGAICVYQHQ